MAQAGSWQYTAPNGEVSQMEHSSTISTLHLGLFTANMFFKPPPTSTPLVAAVKTAMFTFTLCCIVHFRALPRPESGEEGAMVGVTIRQGMLPGTP